MTATGLACATQVVETHVRYTLHTANPIPIPRKDLWEPPFGPDRQECNNFCTFRFSGPGAASIHLHPYPMLASWLVCWDTNDTNEVDYDGC